MPACSTGRCARPLPSLALGVFCASVHAQAACAAMEARWSSLPSRVWRVVWSRGARRRCSRGRDISDSCHTQTALIEGRWRVWSRRAPAASPQTRPKGRKRAGLGLTSSTILGLGSLGGAHPESWSIRLPRDHHTCSPSPHEAHPPAIHLGPAHRCAIPLSPASVCAGPPRRGRTRARNVITGGTLHRIAAWRVHRSRPSRWRRRRRWWRGEHAQVAVAQ